MKNQWKEIKKWLAKKIRLKTNEKKSRGRLHSFFKGYWYSYETANEVDS
jgi:hypothetical protein